MPSSLRVIMSSAPKVVRAFMHHNAAADDAVLATEADEAVLDIDFRDAILVSHDVAKITDVAVLVGWRAVIVLEGIVVRAGAHAAVGEVAVLMHVEAVLLIRGKTADLGLAGQAGREGGEVR